MVLWSGPRPRRTDRSRAQPVGQSGLLTGVSVRASTVVRTGQPHQGDHPCRSGSCVLHRFRFRVGRHFAENGARLLARQRPGQQDLAGRSRKRLSRRELRRHLGRWHCRQPQGVRTGCPGRPSAAHHAGEKCVHPRRAARRRGTGQRTVKHHHPARCVQHRSGHCGTVLRFGRRDRAAQRLSATVARNLRPAQYSADFR